MNILVTGGYGFIGSWIAERFYRENHHIFIIDNLHSGKKENIDFKHRSFIGDVTDEKCESFFKSHSFDVVIHCAAQTNVERSVEEPIEDSSTNILGLINMLNLSRKYEVQNFVFCSSASVYGKDFSKPLKEEDTLDPVSPYGINKMNGELYCRKWEELYGLSALILRFSNVYGPHQHVSAESDVISMYTEKLLNQKEVPYIGIGRQVPDFIYVTDVAEAVYRGVTSRLSGIYNVSNNTYTRNEEFSATPTNWDLEESFKFLKPNAKDLASLQLDNTKLKKELDWAPRVSLEEGLKATLDYYGNKPAVEPVEERKSSSSLWSSQWVQVAENIVLFLMFYMIFVVAIPVIEIIDFWLIYVLVAALIFGKGQAALSSLLAVAVHVNQATSSGRELVSIFMDNTLLATFMLYLLIGIIVSYVVDRQKIELLFTKDDLAASEVQYSFLSSIYEQTLEVKTELQQQILRSDNGISQIYHATRLLDSLEPEELYSGTVKVLEQTLKAQHFAIYSIAPNGFAHLVSKSGDPAFTPASSLKMEENSYIHRAVDKKQFSFNHSLSLSEPLFVAPIVQQNNTIAVIICFDVKFQKLTLSYRNLVEDVTHLISAAFERSFIYMKEVDHVRYTEESRAMKPAYFRRILELKQQSAETLQIPYTLLYVSGKEYEKEKLQSIGAAIRTTDYLGFTEQGKLCIILSNTDPVNAVVVADRLHKKGIKAMMAEEELTHVG